MIKKNGKSTKNVFCTKRKNPLFKLTKRFIEVLLKEKKKSINLKDMVKKMNIQTRSIYDITNVFQGK